jgi:hypothetical protein
MEISIFTDKENIPTNEDLVNCLGSSYELWVHLRDFVFEQYPAAKEEWNYPRKKYGWSFRIKDKKRAIIYLLPRDSYFKVAFVFGQKATDHILSSDISKEIKEELSNARVYAEGRGIRITVKDDKKFADIKKLIRIKLAN